MNKLTGCVVVFAAVVLGTAVEAQPPEGSAGPRNASGSGERRGPPGGGAAGERRGPPGGGPAGERGGPPSPERFIEHAMQFDADGDGKLDRAELTKFAEEMHAMRMRGGPEGRGGPGSQQGESGRREGGFQGPPGGQGSGPGGQGRGPGGQGRGPGGGRGGPRGPGGEGGGFDRPSGPE